MWNANLSIECIQITHEPEPEDGVLMGKKRKIDRVLFLFFNSTEISR